MPDIDALPESSVTVNPTALRSKGFTTSGISQFTSTVQDYVSQLLQRSLHLGDADKAEGLQPEITHDHVKASAHSIARSFGRPPQSNWMIAAHVTEYVAAAVAGVGGGHLDKPWGIAVFGVSLAIAVLLIVVRLARSKGGES